MPWAHLSEEMTICWLDEVLDKGNTLPAEQAIAANLTTFRYGDGTTRAAVFINDDLMGTASTVTLGDIDGRLPAYSSIGVAGPAEAEVVAGISEGSYFKSSGTHSTSTAVVLHESSKPQSKLESKFWL